MKRLRIGYFGHSHNFLGAGDRRRLLYWAKERGHTVVPLSSTNVDLVVTTINSRINTKDLRGPVILDLVDAYSIRNSRMEDFLRRNIRAIDQRTWNFGLSHTELVREIASRVSLTIVSNKEQQSLIENYSKQVINILDFHEEFPELSVKCHITKPETFFWEGSTATLKPLLQIIKFRAKNSTPLHFRLITDTQTPRLLGKYFKVPTLDLIERNNDKRQNLITLIPWSLQNITEAAKTSHLTIIPVDVSNNIAYLKPENRILISWRLGLPVLVSSTPSHLRVARAVDLDFTFDGESDFYERLEYFQNCPSELIRQVSAGKSYLSEFHNKEILLKKWDLAVEMVL